MVIYNIINNLSYHPSLFLFLLEPSTKTTFAKATVWFNAQRVHKTPPACTIENLQKFQNFLSIKITTQ